jgi:hypothetical protein
MDSFSSASKLAFLVFGPMLDVKLVFMYSAVFRRKFLVVLSISLFLLVALLCEPWANVIGRLSNKPVPSTVSIIPDNVLPAEPAPAPAPAPEVPATPSPAPVPVTPPASSSSSNSPSTNPAEAKP